MKFIIPLLIIAGIGNGGINKNSVGESIGKSVVRSTGGVSAPVVTIATQPFTRMVAMGSYTLTGSATNSPSSVTWSTSPSGDSGSCTGTSSWSCVVSVSPTTVAQAIETVTITATNGGGSGIDTEDIGFYVSGAHSWFNAQNVDGSYNSTLANNDPVATWVNLGSSALNVTQGTGAAQPQYIVSAVGGQPAVNFDGGDHLSASLAADWVFLGNGSTQTTEIIWIQPTASGSVYNVLGTANLAAGGRGFSTAMNDSTVNEGSRTYNWDAGGTINLVDSILNTLPAGKYNSHVVVMDSARTPDVEVYLNEVSSATDTTTFNSSNPDAPLLIGKANNGFAITGRVQNVRIYSSVLTTTQLAINADVDEWALGATFPITP